MDMDDGTMKVIYKKPIQDLISDAIEQAKVDKKIIEAFELNPEEWEELKGHLRFNLGWGIPLDNKPIFVDGYLFRLEQQNG